MQVLAQDVAKRIDIYPPWSWVLIVFVIGVVAGVGYWRGATRRIRKGG